MRQFEDLTGQKFGKLTVIGFDKSKSTKHGRYWFCSCSCDSGKIVSAITAKLNNGNMQSCGCSRKEFGAGSKNWRGYGELSGDKWSSILCGAKSRNLPVKITIGEAWALFLGQGRKCALSGVPLVFETRSASTVTTASLDRIDSSKGYEVGNVQWVHKDVNQMKMDSCEDKFITWCKTITEHNSRN